MSHTREHVVAALKDVFPGENVDDLLMLLDRYSVEDYERERECERVQLGIIHLA